MKIPSLIKVQSKNDHSEGAARSSCLPHCADNRIGAAFSFSSEGAIYFDSASAERIRLSALRSLRSAQAQSRLRNCADKPFGKLPPSLLLRRAGRINQAGATFFVLLFLSLSLGTAHAAEPDVTIHLRPHCPETSVTCAAFALYDTQTSITNSLTPGTILDLDIVLTNPGGQPIQSIQSWLSYNPLILQGSDVRISSDFPLVAPGEQTFVEEQGIVRLGASNVSGGMNAQEFVFARVQFKVLAASEDLIPLRFHEFSLLGQEGRTKALVIEGGRTVNVLKTYPNNLFLYFGEDPPPSISPAVLQPPTTGGTQPPTTLPPVSQPPTVQPPVTVPNPLRNLQPQGVRVTTEGDRVYLLWSPLTDPRIAGYNIYYGTVRGRYVQRRTVSSSADGATIRNLPLGQQYYFALTAYDSRGNESEFSYEVAVIVGDPSSSTAPFTLSSDGIPLQGSVITGGRGMVPGGTGMPLGAVIGIALIAFFGSAYFLRFRKIRKALPLPQRVSLRQAQDYPRGPAR